MSIYVCMVCGFDYDEAAGEPGSGIAPGTKWEDVPEDWVCPICGADKSMFTRQGGEEQKPAAPAPEPKKEAKAINTNYKLQAVMASNLARGSKKQYREELSGFMSQVADFFEARSTPQGDLDDVLDLLAQDSATGYAQAFEVARKEKDRGSQRALTWGEKVSAIQATLIKRFNKDGDAALSGNDIFVCDACGFIYVDLEAPDICPVSTVPRIQFNKISKEASA